MHLLHWEIRQLTDIKCFKDDRVKKETRAYDEDSTRHMLWKIKQKYEERDPHKFILEQTLREIQLDCQSRTIYTCKERWEAHAISCFRVVSESIRRISSSESKSIQELIFPET